MSTEKKPHNKQVKTRHAVLTTKDEDGMLPAAGDLASIGGTAYFSVDILMQPLENISELLNFINFYHAFHGMNYLLYGVETIFTDVKKLQSMYDPNNIKTHKKKRTAFLAADIASSAGAIAGNGLMILGQLSPYLSNSQFLSAMAVGTATASGFAIAGGIGAAAAAWAGTAYAGFELYLSARKLNSVYFIEDRLKKMDLLAKKMTAAREKPQTPKTKENLARWQARYDRLENQAVAVAKTRYANIPQDKSEKREQFKQKIYKKIAARKNLSEDNCKKLSGQLNFDVGVTPEQEKLAKELRKNQREQTIHKVINVVAWVGIATGLTLTAVAPFTLHAAPALLTAGMVIGGTGAGLKFGTTVISTGVNKIAGKNFSCGLEKELLKIYGLSDMQQLKRQLALEYALLETQLQNPDNTHLASALCQAAEEKKLNHALKARLNDLAMLKILSPHNITYEKLTGKELQALNAQISPKQKQRMINRRAREVLYADAKKLVVDTAKDPKKQIKTAAQTVADNAEQTGKKILQKFSEVKKNLPAGN